jgi:hypothetical protein
VTDLISMARALENGEPIPAPAAAPEGYPFAGWLAEDPRHATVFAHLMEREDAAGGSGGAANEFTDSLLRYLRKHNRLTEGQVNAAMRGINKRREDDAATPVPEGTQTVTGVVLSIVNKYDPRYDKTTAKMTVRDDRGFKVYGTLPRSLEYSGYLDGVSTGANRDDRVTFTAELTRSDRDQAFGFFKRPRDARKLADGEMVAAAEASGVHCACGKAIPEGVGECGVCHAEALGREFGPPEMTFGEEQLRALRGALSVSIGETDGSDLEHLLHAQITAALEGRPVPTSVELPAYRGGGRVGA